VLLAGFLAGSTAVVVAAVAVKPVTAHAFKLVYGSVFINDNVSPVAIDLASGKPTVRLSNAVAAVSAASSGELDVVPVGESTLMVNSSTGEFNMLDASGLLLKQTGGGVRLPAAPTGSSVSSVTAVASGSSTYLIRSSTGGTQIYLVDEATVAAAVGPQARTVPRASVSLNQPLASGPATAVSADGALWLLMGSGAATTLRELRVPAASNAGATLTATTQAVVSGQAALESIDDTTVALATARTVRLFSASGATSTLAFPSPAGLDDIVAATGMSRRLAFLVHAANGWSLLTAGLHDVAARLQPLNGIPADATLTTPAASGSSLYLLRSDGAGSLWALSFAGVLSPVTGAATYPVLPGEKLDLSGAQVLAEGSRVIVNARANFEAEVIFTDGSHAPMTVDKHSAVQLDPSSTQALVVSHQAGGTRPPSTSKPVKSKPVSAPTVNNRVDCKTSDQTPHIPIVRVVQRGSRSVQLTWTYPLLDTQDCVPSTYTVSAAALDAGAPQPPGTATVQGQDGVNLIGLFPDTDYRLVVTAYLNGLGTASAPVDVRTSVEGPAAPTNVTSTVDNAGNWVVTWHSCGGISDGCVPSPSWQLVPSYCDGLGFSTSPAPQVVIGDPTSNTFSATYAGGTAMLGRGLTFSVAGVGSTGVIGAPATSTSCQYSWTPPVTASISLDASAPPATGEQDTTSTTVTVHFADGQDVDLGGVGGQLTYQLLNGGTVVDSTGPTTRDTASFTDLHPGVHYQVQAVVTPNHHASAAVTIGPVDVQPAIALWPQPTLTAAFADTSSSAGTLTVTLALPAGTDSRGETFDLAGGSLDCGNAHLDLTQTNFAAGKALTFDGIPRAVYNSANAPCTVSGALSQDAGTALAPPLYGAGNSASATSDPLVIDVPTLDTSATDFSADWVDGAPPGKPEITVSYTGSNTNLAAYTHDWTLTASTDSSGVCGSSTASPAAAPATISVDHHCVSGGATWSVAITFSYFGQNASYTITVGGSKPEPVDPSKMNFTASWTDTSTVTSAFVQLHYSGPYDDTTLAALQWSATVTSDLSPGVSCGTSTGYPQADGLGPNIAVDLTACPPTTGSAVASYTVNLSYTDPNFGSGSSYTITVTGAAPQ
jgi:hypothetical protein